MKETSKTKQHDVSSALTFSPMTFCPLTSQMLCSVRRPFLAAELSFTMDVIFPFLKVTETAYLFLSDYAGIKHEEKNREGGTSFSIVKHIVSKIQWEVDFLVDQCSWKSEQRKKYLTNVLGVKFWSIKYKYKILKYK